MYVYLADFGVSESIAEHRLVNSITVDITSHQILHTMWPLFTVDRGKTVIIEANLANHFHCYHQQEQCE